MEVTGRLIVKLWASSSAVDTDFTAKLVDVYPASADFPAGFDLNVGDSIVRARYRDSLATATPMKPGHVYPFTIELYPTSLVFKKGHRIRLDIQPRDGIGSAPYTHYAADYNSGTNTIFAGGARASYLLLPVIPRRA